MKKGFIPVVIIVFLLLYGSYNLIWGSLINSGTEKDTAVVNEEIVDESVADIGPYGGLYFSEPSDNQKASIENNGDLQDADNIADERETKRDNRTNNLFITNNNIKNNDHEVLNSSNDNDNQDRQDSENEQTKAEDKTVQIQAEVSKKIENPERVSLLEKIKIHRVKKGDNLWNIARKYDIDIDTIIGANDISNMNRIQIEDTIKILPVKGIIYRVNPGESLWSIAYHFNVSVDDIVEANALIDPELVQPGMTLILPGAKPEFGYQDMLSQKFIRPTTARISSHYGMRWGKMHEGLDFAVNTGSAIRAARSGKVVYSGWVSGYGYTIILEHQRGVRTLYAHNSKLIVKSGQWVDKGQKIALSGNSGRSTGPHLHFEIQINGKPVNPLNYLN